MGFRNPITTATDPVARATAAQALDAAMNGIVPGTRLAADAIDGKTITGATLRTAASGQRVVIDSTGLNAYSGPTGGPVTKVSAVDGTLTTTGATVDGTVTASGGVTWPDRVKGDTGWVATATTPAFVTDGNGYPLTGASSPQPSWSLVGPSNSQVPAIYGTAVTPRLDLGITKVGSTPTSSVKLTADTITLKASTVIVGGDWTYDLQNSTYNYPVPAAWTTIPGGSASVTVPAGAVLDVEFYAPAGITSGAGDLAVRLDLNGTTVDGAEFQTGATGRAPLRLAGTIAGGVAGRTVAVAVLALAVSGSCSLAATAGGSVTLRHRIR